MLRTVLARRTHLTPPKNLIRRSQPKEHPYPIFKARMDYQPTDTNEIKFESRAGCRVIKLRRHSALNALNLDMLRTIYLALAFWQKSPECRSVVIMAEDLGQSKAFCAGGDVLSVMKLRGNLAQQMVFFKEEYALNHLIAVYSKPIISLWNGYVSIFVTCTYWTSGRGSWDLCAWNVSSGHGED
jgi:hypothetical protein